jgi:tetratricopeptide (TPR) repeat protein
MTNGNQQPRYLRALFDVLRVVAIIAVILFVNATFIWVLALCGFSWITGALIVTGIIVLCARRDIKSIDIHRAYGALRRGDADTALQIALAATKRDSKNIEAYCVAVEILMKQARYNEAVDACDKALSINPGNIYILCNRCRLNLESGNYAAALNDADRALAIDPNCFYAAVMRLRLLRVMNRHEEALEAADKIIRLKPDSRDGCFGRAWALLRMNAYNEALAVLDTLDKLLEVQPSNDYMVAAINLRACVLGDTGRVEEALEQVERGLQIEPTYWAFTVNKGWFYCCLGRFDQAEELLLTVPDDYQHKSVVAYKYSNLARLNVRRGEIESALGLVQKAMELHAEDAAMYVTKGYVLAAANEDERAMEAINKAIALDKFTSDAFWLRHKINEKLGRLDQSEQDKTEALKYGLVPTL